MSTWLSLTRHQIRTTTDHLALSVMAIWPIFLKRTLVTSKTVNVSLEHALNAVQDPPTLIRLNPLVIGYDTKPDDPSHYIIADRLKVMGMDRETKYAAKFSSQPDGMISVVRAGGGVNLKNHWRVRVSEGGEVEIIEEVTVEVSRMMNRQKTVLILNATLLGIVPSNALCDGSAAQVC